MKNLKKLSGILLAIAVLLACTVSAFAVTNTNQGKITIKDPVAGQTYYVYKMFDLETFAGSAYSYKIAVSSPWYNFVKTGECAIYFHVDDQGYVTKTASFTPDKTAEIAKKALEYAKSHSPIISPDVTLPDGDSYVASGLSLGYYLVDSTLGTLCGLNTTDTEVEIDEKNVVPTVSKMIVGGSGEVAENTVSIGDTVNFRTKINAYEGAANYVLHDKMDAGFTWSGTVTVKVGATTLNANTDYELNSSPSEDDCTFEIKFTENYLDSITGTKADPTVIYVEYSAVLNEKAITRTEGDGSNNNEAWLNYNDNGTSTTGTPSKTDTYTYKFDLVKTKSDLHVLDGAEFNLKDGENAISFIYDDAKKEYRVAKQDEVGETTIVAGKVQIRGLEGGKTYTLVETKQPDGYNILKDPKNVVIDTTDLNATMNNADTTLYETGGINVVNETGSLLPSTGGIGTTIFYIVGGVLVAAAVVLLVAKKRTSENR